MKWVNITENGLLQKFLKNFNDYKKKIIIKIKRRIKIGIEAY